MKKALTVLITISVLVLLPGLIFAQLTEGTTLQAVMLDRDNGGRLDHTGWQSNFAEKRLHLIFYINPMDKKLYQPFFDRLKAEQLLATDVSLTAIVNLKASWIPSSIVISHVEKKQEPGILYLLDRSRFVRKQWALDADNCAIAVDQTGKVLFYRTGKLSGEDSERLVKLLTNGR